MKYYALKFKKDYVLGFDIDGSLTLDDLSIECLSVDYKYLYNLAISWNGLKRRGKDERLEVVEVRMIENVAGNSAETILGVKFFDEGYRFD